MMNKFINFVNRPMCFYNFADNVITCCSIISNITVYHGRASSTSPDFCLNILTNYNHFMCEHVTETSVRFTKQYRSFITFISEIGVLLH